MQDLILWFFVNFSGGIFFLPETQSSFSSFKPRLSFISRGNPASWFCVMEPSLFKDCSKALFIRLPTMSLLYLVVPLLYELWKWKVRPQPFDIHWPIRHWFPKWFWKASQESCASSIISCFKMVDLLYTVLGVPLAPNPTLCLHSIRFFSLMIWSSYP